MCRSLHNIRHKLATRNLGYLNELRNEKNATLIAAKTELEKLAHEKTRLIQAIKDGVPA